MIGRKIKRLRIERGITQQDLIHGLFDRTYLSQIELGKKSPPQDTIVILADRLGVSVDVLNNYSEKVTQANATLLKARETKSIELAKTAWELCSSVQAIEVMIPCAIEWEGLQSGHGTDTMELLEAINHTFMLASTLGETNEPFLSLILCRGNRYFFMGMFEQSVWTYKLLIKRSPPLDLFVRAKISLGSSYMCLDKFREALVEFSDLDGLTDIDLLQRGRVYQGMGGCYRYLKMWDASLKYLEAARNVFRDLDSYRYMQIIHSLGVLWLDKLEYQQASVFFDEAHSFYLQNYMQVNQAELYEEFARAAYYQGQYDLADAWCTDGLNIINGGNPPLAGKFFLWKSWIYHFKGMTDKELNSWEAAKNLLGSQFKFTVWIIDPNMRDEIRKITEEHFETDLESRSSAARRNILQNLL